MVQRYMLDDGGGGSAESSVPNAMDRSQYTSDKNSFPNKDYKNLVENYNSGSELDKYINNIQKLENEMLEELENLGRNLSYNVQKTSNGQYSDPVTPDPSSEKPRAIISATFRLGLAAASCTPASILSGYGAFKCGFGLPAAMTDLAVTLAADDNQLKAWNEGKYVSIMDPIGLPVFIISELIGYSNKQSFDNADSAKTVSEVTESIKNIYGSKSNFRDYVCLIDNAQKVADEVKERDKKNQKNINLHKP